MEKNRTLFFIFLSIAVVVLVSGGFLWYRLENLGMFYESERTTGQECMVVRSVPGPEDMDVDPLNQVVYISGNNRRQTGNKPATNGIWLLTVKQGRPNVQQLTVSGVQEFNPHGISFYRGERGEARLFVINHRSRNVETVEIFELVTPDTLVHRQTVTGKPLVSPNDLAAAGLRSFYFTNDGRSRTGLSRTIDTIFNRSTGSIGYYDGKNLSLEVEGLTFPNGIGFSRKRSELYVAETTSGVLKTFEIGSDPARLMMANSRNLGVGLDNIHTDSAGHLWIARHPNLVALSMHMSNPESLSPSQVIQVNMRAQDPGSSIIFMDDGSRISGASVGLPFKEYLVIGAAFDNRILVCRNQ